jgi:hypothetical protein
MANAIGIEVKISNPASMWRRIISPSESLNAGYGEQAAGDCLEVPQPVFLDFNPPLCVYSPREFCSVKSFSPNVCGSGDGKSVPYPIRRGNAQEHLGIQGDSP